MTHREVRHDPQTLSNRVCADFTVQNLQDSRTLLIACVTGCVSKPSMEFQRFYTRTEHSMNVSACYRFSHHVAEDKYFKSLEMGLESGWKSSESSMMPVQVLARSLGLASASFTTKQKSTRGHQTPDSGLEGNQSYPIKPCRRPAPARQARCRHVHQPKKHGAPPRPRNLKMRQDAVTTG